MTETGSSPLYPPYRTKSRTIKGGEWRLRWTLDIEGHEIDAGELRYADTFLASSPAELGRLVAVHLNERAQRQMKKGRK